MQTVRFINPNLEAIASSGIDFEYWCRRLVDVSYAVGISRITSENLETIFERAEIIEGKLMPLLYGLLDFEELSHPISKEILRLFIGLDTGAPNLSTREFGDKLVISYMKRRAELDGCRFFGDDTCLRCGGKIARNDGAKDCRFAISRTDNETEICTDCGTHEATQAMRGNLSPQHRWALPMHTKQGR